MKTELDKSLIMLKRSDKIEVWQDRELVAGQEWDKTITDEISRADIILLLISVDFNNSQYIWDKELAVAMQRHENGEARVIPIILRECEWRDMPYGKLQALPRAMFLCRNLPVPMRPIQILQKEFVASLIICLRNDFSFVKPGNEVSVDEAFQFDSMLSWITW